ncbi:hypothetical protein TYRP_021591 [Tyrophagus putrescentiae]|nr:hypothetical protein TYRP_021591 [Tyrophagus putrescentiae]
MAPELATTIDSSTSDNSGTTAAAAAALADDFFNRFNVSKLVENDPKRPHPKFSTYCRKFCSNSEDGMKRLQEKRRQELLENLKRKRQKILDNLRPIIDCIEDTEDCEELPILESSTKKIKPKNNADISMAEEAAPAECKSDAMQVDNPQGNKGGNAKRNRFLRNRAWRQKNEKELRKLISKQLMLSEWLVDVPSDFFTDWFMVLCPRGKRTLVVAAKGKTSVYSRTGYFMFEFQSLLPGGSHSNRRSSKGGSALDAIYVEEEHTFYVLDLISLNGYSFLDCEAEFRFFWLKSRFAEEYSTNAETPQKSPFKSSSVLSVSDVSGDSEMADVEADQSEILSPSKPNVQSKVFNFGGATKVSKLFNFVPLHYHQCTAENIVDKAKGPYQFNGNIDGVLFFHKHAPYTPGITPLVCWLKVDMIPDILQIPI